MQSTWLKFFTWASTMHLSDAASKDKFISYFALKLSSQLFLLCSNYKIKRNTNKIVSNSNLQIVFLVHSQLPLIQSNTFLEAITANGWDSSTTNSINPITKCYHIYLFEWVWSRLYKKKGLIGLLSQSIWFILHPVKVLPTPCSSSM